MIHRYWLMAACIIAFGVRESSATKESYELLWYPNTYDLPGGLTLGNHSSSLSTTAVELSGRSVLPFLDPSASPVGAAFLFFPPPTEGGRLILLPPPRLRRRRVRWGRRANPTTPGAGNSFGSLWPSPWPSSPAPREVPKPVASLSVRLLGLRAKGPDSQTVRMSSSSPVKGAGV